MNQITLRKMSELLKKKGIKVCGTAEEFYGDSDRWEDNMENDRGLWIAADETPEFFDYYGHRQEWGIDESLEKLADDNGYYWEWNDPGTIMIWKTLNTWENC